MRFIRRKLLPHKRMIAGIIAGLLALVMILSLAAPMLFWR